MNKTTKKIIGSEKDSQIEAILKIGKSTFFSTCPHHKDNTIPSLIFTDDGTQYHYCPTCGTIQSVAHGCTENVKDASQYFLNKLKKEIQQEEKRHSNTSLKKDSRQKATLSNQSNQKNELVQKTR
ncbi:MAG: hypothetical protein WC667_13480 [Sulfurimonas sp.]|jgi:hypothetical protein